ncbi:MAG: hypothetical protein WKF43_01495 [Acidimicrobiales bacterium]
METYVVRLWLPDRPGALGAVASRIGAVRGDVIGIDILETGSGQAVDELVVRLPQKQLVTLLVQEIEQVDGVQVEFVRAVADSVHDPRLDGLEMAAVLAGAATTEALLEALCDHGGRTLGAEWVSVLDLASSVVHRSSGPAPTGPWLARRGRQPRRRRPTTPPLTPACPTTWPGPRPRCPLGHGPRPDGDAVSFSRAAAGGCDGADRRHPLPGAAPARLRLSHPSAANET